MMIGSDQRKPILISSGEGIVLCQVWRCEYYEFKFW
jgi:hypothetical protein